MRKLSLSILAASAALLPCGAIAQAGPPAPPPPAAMQAMQAGGAMQSGVTTYQTGPMQGGVTTYQTGPMQGQYYQRRLQRGFVVPQYWWGPQFQINNWQMYGFPNPGADGRWIRYYDDAYLIDHQGHIRDTREGLDWDRYGEQWEVANGIPAYRGSRDYHPGPQDYAWSQGQMANGQQMQGYGYGGGYTQVYGGGYGYGAYAYPIVIETVTTAAAAATTYSEEVVEEWVQVRHHHRARPCCCRPAPRRAPPPPRPRPPAGERG